MYPTTLFLLLNATLATLYMVIVAGVIALLVGLPLGILLYVTRPGNIFEHKGLQRILALIVNITRSIPFVILMIAVIPLTRFVVGTSIGVNAAIVPLSLAAMPFIARVVENALLEVNKGLIEAGIAMGANGLQIILKILIPEALPGLINGFTLTMVSLIGYSAMAGAVGGGGLGDVAIRYGYQRFDVKTMLLTIFIMIILVQGTQWFGDFLARRFSNFRK